MERSFWHWGEQFVTSLNDEKPIRFFSEAPFIWFFAELVEAS
jgi:hypothetical protein